LADHFAQIDKIELEGIIQPAAPAGFFHFGSFRRQSVVPLCTQTNSAGKTCASPALRGRNHCYFHNPARRASGPRRPTTRPGYRWYSLYRKLSKMRPEQAIPIWNQVVEAVLKHEISREWVLRIMKRYTARVTELGAARQQRENPQSCLIQNTEETRKIPNIHGLQSQQHL
jgi:hypothetical protein